MAMMSLAHRMQVFGIVHHAGLQKERSKLRWDAAVQAKIRAAVLPDAHALLKRRLGKKQACVRLRAPNKGAGHSDGRAGLHIHE